MKGFPGGGMAQLMKQANQMQMKMKKIQEELSQKHYKGTAGGGVVEVTVNGEHLIQSVKIAPDVIQAGDAEMVQDMIKAAANDAVQSAKTEHAKEMEKVTGGLGVPGLF